MAEVGGVTSVEFLTLEIVLAAHQRGLDDWGGQDGVRDFGGLESAIAQPQATFDGQYLHATIWGMAAAYAFYIAERQPFLDGNKRAGGLCATAFLKLNGITLREGCDSEIHGALIAIAEKRKGRNDLAALFEALSV